MKSVLIVGYGVVGQYFAKEINSLHPDIYDKFKTEFNAKKDKKYDFAFICVDTPYVSKENPCDISQVINAIKENEAENYIIKSTILPMYLESIIEKFNFEKRIIFSPESYGGTQHCNNFEFNFTILGGERDTCYKVQQLLQEVYDARHIFRIVDGTTATLVKYMENSFLATKVAFCLQFYDVCKQLNISYEELRELFILDPRVNPSHTFIYEEHPYYKSHCLDKDVPAIANTFNMELLKEVINYNNKFKNNGL